MTPAQLERLHRAAFTFPRPWRAQEFEALLSSPHVTLHEHPHGFALTRAIAGEAELLTLAVDPAHQRRGIARSLLGHWLKGADPCLDRAFLEVAAPNHPALSLYRNMGFDVIGTRPAYYSLPDGGRVDALIMQRVLSGA